MFIADLDTKRWDAWAELFTDDFVLDTSSANGPPSITGRDAVLKSVRAAIDTARTAHQVHMPEIAIDGNTASGIWALQDRLVFGDGTTMTGYGHYSETYVRIDDKWRIGTSKLTRLPFDVSPPVPHE